MRFQVRETLVITLLTFLVVTTTLAVHQVHVMRIVVTDTLREVELIARQVYAQSARGLTKRPRDHPLDVLRTDRELRTLVDSSVGYSPHLLYALIADRKNHVLIASDTTLEGTVVPPRPPFSALVSSKPLPTLYAMYYGAHIDEVVLPLDLNGRPLGAIRMGIAIPLVRKELQASLLRGAALGGVALLAALCVAIGLSNVTLRPIRQLATEMDRLIHGEFDVDSKAGPTDEFGKLAFQLQLLGREISSDRSKLLRERSQFQTAVEHLEDGVIFVGADGGIRFANRAIDQVLGTPVGAAEGAKLASVLGSDHPVCRFVGQAFEQGTSLRSATLTIPVGDTTVDVVASLFLIAGGHPTWAGAIVLLRDVKAVTVSARTLQSLIRYSAQLTALGRMTAQVTHEVKNPLNAVMIHTELLAERLGAASTEVRHSLDVIRDEIRQLDTVVQKFLQMIRPDEVALKPLDLNALIDDVVALFAAEWQTSGIVPTVDLEPGLAPVAADDETLRRALINILLNACQAMPEGGVLSVTTERGPGGYAKVTVTDTGVGIPPEALERIFAMYYTTKPDGTGMGLPVARRIVETHGGEIRVMSTVGRGTSVVILLPLLETS
jgi:signal transduction histidine kinase